jgi:hypothetical protein
VSRLVPIIEAAAPGVPNARWIAIRLLDGDAAVEEALSRAARRARGPAHRPHRHLAAFGLPLMLLMLAVIFWLTIVGANVPSQMLATKRSSGSRTGCGLFEGSARRGG